MTTLKALLAKPWFGPLCALALVYVTFAALAPDTFLGAVNLFTMTRQTVVVAVAAVGMTFVIVHGGIDLSVGSLVALTTVVMALALRAGFGPVEASLVGILVPTLAGLANGALVAGLGMTPFIVTLGAMSIFRGAAKGLANEQKLDVMPQGLDSLMAAPPPGEGFVPPGVWIALLVVTLGAVALRYTVFGRHVVAIGSNEATARLCGIPVGRERVLVYALAGALAGLSGVMEFSTLTVGDPTDSIGLELEVIAAVVIGGASLSGGRGSVIGSAVGALLMTEIKTGCTHVGFPNWVQEILTGVIIVVAVAIDRFRSAGQKR